LEVTSAFPFAKFALLASLSTVLFETGFKWEMAPTFLECALFSAKSWIFFEKQH
jgi:hypothetical protein